MRRVAYACALLLALACGRDDVSPEETAAESLGRLLDPSLGEGLPAVESATGPMTLALASRATAVRPGDLRPWLETHGFQGGYSRVWQRGEGESSEVVTALVLHFFADRNATELVAFSTERISTSALYQAFDDPAVPGARGYSLTSRVNRTTKFCVGEYFMVARDAYVVTRCAPFPLQPHAVTGLARKQLVHAITAGASPSPDGSR